MGESEEVKQVRIRSGVVKRLRKELAAYSSECEREQEKVEKMRADGADAHDIKQQVRRSGTEGRAPTRAARPARRDCGERERRVAAARRSPCAAAPARGGSGARAREPAPARRR